MEDKAQQPNANDRSYVPGQDDDDKKVFVGGLGRTITEDELHDYFMQYGDIENINIKIHPFSGESRGFAFVQFVNAKTVDDLLAVEEHSIANKKIVLKRVIRRVNPLLCKIFVTGLTYEITEEDVRNYFVQFGQIIDFHQPFDKIKKQKKSYCFITFQDSEVVNQILENPKRVINGQKIHVRKFKFNSMTANGARAGPMGDARGPATFGMRSVYPGYMALETASPYGTAANNSYAYGAYSGNGYSATGYGGGGYRAQAYPGGQYREATYPRHAFY
ncbi:RNA-binding protein squid-like [Aphis gossypii]|uniref:RNA-binding protein squid-like n=1 Tax=Aphis gossypii TaxID=80765 RepID=UPI00215952A7|nr:RNA-binding protein squid-like [Aphis gossypii]XP_050061398.1 RNA-binding protein squid-like [Aphis gossypii]